MEIEGKIILDMPMVEGISKAGNAWRKKEWVLETFGSYPRKVCFNAFGDRIAQMNLQLGHSYAISIDIESREFNGRWYTDVRAFAAREITEGGMQQPPQAQQPSMAAGTQSGANFPPFGSPAPGMPQQGFSAPEGNESDDLPF